MFHICIYDIFNCLKSLCHCPSAIETCEPLDSLDSHHVRVSWQPSRINAANSEWETSTLIPHHIDMASVEHNSCVFSDLISVFLVTRSYYVTPISCNINVSLTISLPGQHLVNARWRFGEIYNFHFICTNIHIFTEYNMMKYIKTVLNFCRNETQKLHTAQWMSLKQMKYMIEQYALQLSTLYSCYSAGKQIYVKIAQMCSYTISIHYNSSYLAVVIASFKHFINMQSFLSSVGFSVFISWLNFRTFGFS